MNNLTGSSLPLLNALLAGRRFVRVLVHWLSGLVLWTEQELREAGVHLGGKWE